MPYNFWLIGLAKFRHVAILAISSGYFGYFLFWIWFDFLFFAHFEFSIPWAKKWHMSQFMYLRFSTENGRVYPWVISNSDMIYKCHVTTIFISHFKRIPWLNEVMELYPVTIKIFDPLMNANVWFQLYSGFRIFLLHLRIQISYFTIVKFVNFSC